MQNSANRVNMLQLCAQDIVANADKLLADVPEKVEIWSIADDNSRDAIEEMAEQLGETPEWVKEYMSKITLEDIHKAFQDFRDAMVTTRENN